MGPSERLLSNLQVCLLLKALGRAVGWEQGFKCAHARAGAGIGQMVIVAVSDLSAAASDSQVLITEDSMNINNAHQLRLRELYAPEEADLPLVLGGG
jgi:hypothetical protein